MMAKSDKNPEAAEHSGGRELNFLSVGPVWLVFLLLLLATAGTVITWLFGFLGAALGACFWALWAAAALAVAATLMKRISAFRAKRQKKPEPPPAERNQPQSIPEQQKAVGGLKGERTRRSQRWIFTIERITDEKKS
jgi:hypothetical protein